MEYGSVIQRAWSMTWRHRFLWVLGLFATSATGGTFYRFGGNRGVGPPATGTVAAGAGAAWALRAEELGASTTAWLQSHPGTVASIIGGALLLGLAALIVSIIMQGGMAVATVQLAEGRPASLGSAWHAGTQLFWRYVLLYLACLAVAILGSLVISLAVAIVVSLVSLPFGAAAVGTNIAAVLGVVLVLLSIPFTIIIGFAQRLVALEHRPIWASIGEGWQLLRAHWQEAGIAWLISFGLAIALAIGVAVVAGIAVAILGGIGFGVWSAAGIGAVLAYGGVGLLLLFAGLWLMEAIYNTFFWSYWSLVYLDFHGGVHEPGVGELPRAA